MKKEITFKIIEEIAVLSCKGGWATELNKVSWNDAPAKFDIRSWNEDHTSMGKGITLTQAEASALCSALSEYV